MISLQVIPDRFSAAGAQAAASSAAATKGVKPFIRRPTRGIVLKEETFATLRVVSGNGENKLLVDAGSRRGPAEGEFYATADGKRATDIYSNFILQAVQEERQEKSQILETFGEAYIFLFGERARVISFSGVLLNTFDFNWEAEWWYNYENFLRGTRCVENDTRVYLSFDETLVSGYIVGASASKNTNDPHVVNFQFQLFLTSYSNFSKIGDPHALAGVNYPDNANIYSQELSAGSDAPFLPKLITQSDIESRNESLRALGDSIVESGNQTAMPNLTEGILRNGLSPVLQTFSTAQQIVNSALKSLSNLAAGEVIRVPIGFEGSLAFDADTSSPTYQADSTGIVTYSTFDKNDDEYVGVGSHFGASTYYSSSGQYASSFMKLRGLTDPYEQQIQEEQDSISATINRARQAWNEAGLDVPANQLGPISAFIAGRQIGLLAAGATVAWRTKKFPTPQVVKLRGG